MPVLTKKLIQESFLKLAAQRPVDKITVKDIVDDCQINRNSFYYHFEDMPNLIEITLEEAILEVINSRQTESLQELFNEVFDVFEQYESVIRNVYYSKHREIVEYKTLTIAGNLVSRYLQDNYFAGAGLDPLDEQTIVRYYKCFIVGQLMEWMTNGSRYDVRKEFERLCILRQGTLESMIAKAKETARS